MENKDNKTENPEVQEPSTPQPITSPLINTQPSANQPVAPFSSTHVIQPLSSGLIIDSTKQGQPTPAPASNPIFTSTTQQPANSTSVPSFNTTSIYTGAMRGDHINDTNTTKSNPYSSHKYLSVRNIIISIGVLAAAIIILFFTPLKQYILPVANINTPNNQFAMYPYYSVQGANYVPVVRLLFYKEHSEASICRPETLCQQVISPSFSGGRLKYTIFFGMDLLPSNNSNQTLQCPGGAADYLFSIPISAMNTSAIVCHGVKISGGGYDGYGIHFVYSKYIYSMVTTMSYDNTSLPRLVNMALYNTDIKRIVESIRPLSV